MVAGTNDHTMTAMLARRTLRPITRVLVVAWLLALAVSWANACIAGPGASQDAALHHGVLAGTDADPSWTHGDAPAQAAALAACQGFCNHVQNAVAKSPLPDVGDLGWSLPAFAPMWAPWPRSADGAAIRASVAPPPPALPVRIAFVRLNR